MCVAGKEMIGRTTESLPQRLRAALLHRTDGLPLGLQPLHLEGAGVPIGRILQGVGTRTEGFLFREIVCPDCFPLRQVGMTPREEAITCAAESLPDRFLLTAA